MRRVLIILLTAAGLLFVGCGGKGGDEAPEAIARPRPPAHATRPAPTTTAAPAPAPTSTTTAPPTTAPVVARAKRTPEPHYVCPATTLAEVRDLQQAFDQGHQPWLRSPEAVAGACTFGPGASIQPVGPHRYRVTDPKTDRTVIVELTQPLGPDGIFVVARVSVSG